MNTRYQAPQVIPDLLDVLMLDFSTLLRANSYGEDTFVSKAGVTIEGLLNVGVSGKFPAGDFFPVRNLVMDEAGIASECHAVALWRWLKQPTLQYVLGFALLEGTWNFHSFLLMEDGAILEPTPFRRELYYGRIFSPEETLIALRGRVGCIKRLNLPLSLDEIQKLYAR